MIIRALPLGEVWLGDVLRVVDDADASLDLTDHLVDLASCSRPPGPAYSASPKAIRVRPAVNVTSCRPSTRKLTGFDTVNPPV
jgi:hypothetical protein